MTKSKAYRELTYKCVELKAENSRLRKAIKEAIDYNNDVITKDAEFDYVSNFDKLPWKMPTCIATGNLKILKKALSEGEKP